VRSDLVRAPRLRNGFNPCVLTADADKAKIGDGIFTAFFIDDGTVLCISVGKERFVGVQRFPQGSSVDETVINFFDFSVFELKRERTMRFFIARIRDRARRIFIDTVHGKEFSELAFSFDVEPRGRFVVPVGGDEQSAFFIQYDDIVVRIEHRVRRYCFHKNSIAKCSRV